MSFVRTLRWVRSCLLGCLVFAQVAVVLSMHDHILNVYETVPVATHHHVRTNIAAPDANHHHGVTDFQDQCCALHSLAGPLPHQVNVMPVAFEGARIPLPELFALTYLNYHRLDRPPKSLPLI